MSRVALRRFLALPGRDKRVMFEALWLLIRLRFELRSRGMDPLLRKLTQATGTSNSHDPQTCQQVANALARAHRLSLKSFSCLERAMAGASMLKRRRQGFVIEVGMRRKLDGRVAGHAWLQTGDQLICGGEEARAGFMSIVRFEVS